MLIVAGKKIGIWTVIFFYILTSTGVGNVHASPVNQDLSSTEIASVEIKSLDTPQILQVHPKGGYLSERSTNVQVTFSQAMNQEQTESAFSIQPDLPHKFRWLDATTLQIEFTELFKPGVQYALTFSGEETKDTTGQRIQEDYRWYYWLDPFTIDLETPEPNKIKLKFSHSINWSKSRSPFEIQPELEGKWIWQSTKTLVFISSKPIPPAKSYTLQLMSPLYDKFGEIVFDERTLSFSAPAPVVSVEPKDGDYVHEDFAAIQINFSEAVEKLSAQNAFSISPPIKGVFSWKRSTGSSFDNVLIFTPTELFQGRQDYTVSLSPALKNIANRPLILESFHWTFTVVDYYSSYPAIASFGGYGSNVQVVDVNGPRRIQYSGKDPIQFEAYRYDLNDFVKLYSEDFGWGYSLPRITLPDPSENRLVASWNSTDDEIGGIRETIIPPQIEPGLYVLNMKHDGRTYSQLFLILSRNTIMAKIYGDQIFAWVTDINGDAIPNTEIRLYSSRGEKIREGKTDEQGFYQGLVPTGYQPMLVTARVPGTEDADVAVTGLTNGWNSYDGWVQYNNDPAKYLVYTYTDRPIYKPGQTINYKSIIRHDHDVSYSIPLADTPITINIRDPRNNLIQSIQITTNEFGTVNGSFTIAEGAPLGNYTIETNIEGEIKRQVFRVEDYRKPEYQVTLEPSNPQDDNQLIVGESLDLDVDVNYFFGEPVPNAKLTYNYYRLYPYYDWWNSNPEEVQYTWYATWNEEENVLTTNEDGKAKLQLWTDQGGYSDYGTYSDWRSSLRTKTFAVEVTADDGNNQPVSGYYIYTVTNAAEKIGLDTSGYFKNPNTPFIVKANVQTLSGDPVPLRDLSLEVSRWNREIYKYAATPETFSMTTDMEGVTTLKLELDAGYYKLTLTGMDTLGNRMTLESWLSVFSENSRWNEDTYEQLVVSAEKKSYQPNETARLMIESSFDGPALLTFERGSVLHTQQVLLTAPFSIIETDILPEYAPNVYVTINAWEATNRDDPKMYQYLYSNIPDSQMHIARTELQMPAESKALDIILTTDQSEYAPGDPITVGIEVRDGEQNPVQAEVSLALVDEAIFSLSNELSPAIFKAFYGARPLSVDTYNSMNPYREIIIGDRGGGSDTPSLAGVRTDFPDTAAWYPDLVTDLNGKVSVTFTLPDNLTSWRLSAKAITLTHQVGEKHINIETKQNLLLRPILPRVLTTGDQAYLTVMVHNYSNEDRKIKVSLNGVGLDIQDDPTQSLVIPSNGVVTAGWRVIPTGTTETQLTFSAIGSDGSSDAVQIPILIQPLSIREIQSTSGEFTGNTNLNIPMPQNLLMDNSQVILRISNSPASSLLDGLEFLTGYPYGCVEQTMSRAMPNAVLGRASYQLGLGGEQFNTQLDPLIQASIQRLYGFQHADGGWGWWLDDKSDTYQSAWVLHGLAIIQSAGYPIEPNVMEHAAEYLISNLNKMDARTKAYALYSMALAGKGNLIQTQSLADTSLRELDPFSQAALALTLHHLGDTTRSEVIINILESSALLDKSFAYWPQDATDGEYHRKTMASSLRTTAFVLSAILTVDGKDNLYVEPAANYLISKRNGYGWGTTNETSFTILALTDYLSTRQNENDIDEYKVQLNGSPLANGTLEHGRVSVNIEIPFSSLKSGTNQLQLNTAGNSPLYYDLITRYTISESEIEASGNVGITRRYLDLKTGDVLKTINLGQLIRVELSVRMPQPGSYILIEDHLPGGLEALNQGLNTTGHATEYYSEYYDPLKYLWQEFGYNYKEIRGDRVSFFITDMKKGLTVLTYLTRATTSGTFTALPSEASAMYDSKLWGRSSDNVVIIHDPK